MNINEKDIDNNTILLKVCKLGIKDNLRLIQKIIELGGDPNITNVDGDNYYSIIKNEAVTNNEFIGFLKEKYKTNEVMNNGLEEKNKKWKFFNFKFLLLGFLVIFIVILHCFSYFKLKTMNDNDY